MANRYLSLEKRFWKLVNKNGPIYPGLGRCWLWLGANREGYGIIKVSGKQVRSSKVSWMLEFGEYPNAPCMLHKCDNPQCVNPVHVFPGTRPENSADMVSKMRQKYGEDQPQAKITEKQAIDIIHRYRRWGAVRLSREFSLSVGQIRRIANGKSWKHLRLGI